MQSYFSQIIFFSFLTVNLFGANLFGAVRKHLLENVGDEGALGLAEEPCEFGIMDFTGYSCTMVTFTELAVVLRKF
jgi:hypothetical protein